MRKKYVLENEGLLLRLHDPFDWALLQIFARGDMSHNEGVTYACTAAHVATAGYEPGTGGDYEDVWIALAAGSVGATGEDGTDAYVYVAYASDDDGADFTNTFDPDLDYFAVKSTTTPLSPPAVGDFAGLWKNCKGIKGDPGGEIGNWAIQEVPSGTQNGSNKNFVLGHTPTGPVSVKYNGLEYQNSVDYSYSDTVLTLITFAPNSAEGDRFWVTYPY